MTLASASFSSKYHSGELSTAPREARPPPGGREPRRARRPVRCAGGTDALTTWALARPWRPSQPRVPTMPSPVPRDPHDHGPHAALARLGTLPSICPLPVKPEVPPSLRPSQKLSEAHEKCIFFPSPPPAYREVPKNLHLKAVSEKRMRISAQTCF